MNSEKSVVRFDKGTLGEEDLFKVLRKDFEVVQWNPDKSTSVESRDSGTV